MGRFDTCPHCGGEGICPPGHCGVRDSPFLPAPATARKAPPRPKMPAAAEEAPAARRQLRLASDLFTTY